MSPRAPSPRRPADSRSLRQAPRSGRGRRPYLSQPEASECNERRLGSPPSISGAPKEVEIPTAHTTFWTAVASVSATPLWRFCGWDDASRKPTVPCLRRANFPGLVTALPLVFVAERTPQERGPTLQHATRGTRSSI